MLVDYESFLLVCFIFDYLSFKIYFVGYRKFRKVVTGDLAQVLALMLVYLGQGSI